MNDNFDENWFDEFGDDSEGNLDNSEYQADLASLNEYYRSVKANPVVFDLDSLEDYISLAMELGEFNIGLELADAYLKFSTYDSEIWQKKGIFHLHLGQYDEAEEALKKAYSLNPTDIETLMNLASVYGRLNYPELELYYLEQANQIAPENKDIKFNLISFYEDNEPEKAIEIINYMLQGGGDNQEKLDLLTELAFSYELVGKIEEAIEAYYKILEIDPFNFLAYYNLGVLYSSLERWNKAIENFKFSIAVNENFSSSHFNLGYTYASLGNYKEAIESYKRALEIEPEDYSAWYNLGLSYEAINDFRNAVNAYTKSIESNTNYVNSYIARGYCYQEIGEIEHAEKDFNQAIKIDPENHGCWLALADFELSRGHFEQAIECYSKALALNPDEPDSYLFLANAYFEKGDLTQALKYYDECTKYFPENAEAYYHQAKILFILNKPTDAFNNLKRCFNFDPTLREKFEKEFPDLAKTKAYINTINTIQREI